MAAEMATMRELVTQLNAIGVGLNYLVRAANEGAIWAGGGVVMVAAFRDRLANGASIDDAIREGAMLRLRPILMVALVAAPGSYRGQLIRELAPRFSVRSPPS